MRLIINESQLNFIISEGTISSREKKVRDAYELMVQGAKGVGTDPDKIINGLKKLGNNEEFFRLNSLFSDKRTGYSAFDEMINGEFGYQKIADNHKDLTVIKTELNRLQIEWNTTFTEWFDWPVLHTDNTKETNPLSDVTEKKFDDDCVNNCQIYLKDAKSWWIEHLKNPHTKRLFIKAYESIGKKMSEAQVNSIFSKYYDIISKIKLKFYDQSMVDAKYSTYPKGALAFAPSSTPDIVFVNCSEYLENSSMESWVTNLVHEIQHQLYEFFPLAPPEMLKKIRNNNRIETINLPNDPSKNLYINANLSKNAINYGINLSVLKKWYNFYLKKKKTTEDKGYFCRDTEQISRVEGLRALLGYKVGTRFVVSSLLPFFYGQQKDPDFTYLIFCWLESGAQDLQTYFDGLSSIAKNQKIKLPTQKPNYNV